MSKNTNLSFLTDYITADITNGRIGINNASPTVAFDVVGVAKFSSSVTATSLGIGLTAAAKIQAEVGNTTSVGLFSASGLAITSSGGSTGNVYQIAFGYGSGGATYGSSALYGTTESSAGYNTGALVFATRSATTDTAPTEKMRITSAGNVGIGVTPSAWASPTAGKVIQLGNRASVFSYNNSTTDIASNLYFNGSDYIYIETAFSTLYRQGSSDGTHSWFSAASGTAGTSVPLAERMRITSGGNVLVGTTTDSSFLFDVSANTTNYAAMVRNITSSACNGLYIYFPNSTSSTTSQAFLRGESAAGVKAMIYSNGSYGSATGTYGSIVSDLRLKENISDATSKLDDILKLRVVNFNITSDLEKKKQIGFIAQEFKEVFPSLVFETDTREYDKNGNLIKGLENAMGLSVGMEFAILTKAIQELSAEINLLKQK